MSKHKGVDVRILNPASGRGYTSRKCAERYVRRGIARWVKDERGRNCVEFLSGADRAATVAVSVARETAYDRAVRTGIAQIPDLANLPMIAPGVALGLGRRKGASRHTFVANSGTPMLNEAHHQNF